MVGPCFIYGEMGYLKKTCTKAVHGQERWYPGNTVEDSMTKGSVEFLSSKCNSWEVHVGVQVHELSRSMVNIVVVCWKVKLNGMVRMRQRRVLIVKL